MEFDPDKWKEIERQWEEDDLAGLSGAGRAGLSGAIQGAANTDATELAKSETWAGFDLANKPMQGPMPDAPEVDAPSLMLEDAQKPAPLRLAARAPSPEPRKSVSQMDWKELANRMAMAEAGKGVSQGMETLFANVGAQSGYRPNTHAGEQLTASAKQPLDLAKERQGFESRQADIDTKRAASGVKKAMDDPNSLQSQKAREAVKSFFGDVRLPAGFDNWSANDVQKFASTGALAQVQRTRNAAEDDARKVAAAGEKAAAERTALDNSRKAFGNELKDLGIDPQHASQKDIDRAISLRHAKATEAQARAALAHNRDKEDDKKTEDVPPGYEITPGANPGPDSRKKFTALVASQQKLKNLTAKMRQAMQGAGKGDQVLPGAKRDQLNQLATQIGIEAKNVAELGALSGPDMDLMNAMVKNPTSAWNLFSDIAGNMGGLDSWADESVRAGENAYGLRRVGGGSGGSLKTRKTKSGGTAYQSPKSGRWFTTPEEAQAN